MPGFAAPLKTLLREGARWCAGAILTLVFWSVWLALAFLLAVQVYVARTSEMRLPLFVQRAVEERLAASGIHVVFRNARFDPLGRILAEDVRLTLPGYEETLVTARGVYARLNPWALLVDRFEPLELEVTGVSLRIPAMLSPSGTADEIVRDLDADLRSRGSGVSITYLNCRLGAMTVALRGSADMSSLLNRRGAPLPVAEFLARNYAALCREGAAIVASLSGFDRPRLTARLTPSRADIARVDATLVADGLQLQAPLALQAKGVRIRGQIPLWGPRDRPVRAYLDLEEVGLPKWGVRGQGLRAWLQARLAATASGIRTEQGVEVGLTAGSLAAAGLEMQEPLVSAQVTDWGTGQARLRGAVRGELWAEPLTVRADLDFKERSGAIELDGLIAPAVVGFLEQRLHRNLHPWVGMHAPALVNVRAEFAPAWKFARARGELAVTDLTARDVHLDEVRGRFEFDGRRLIAPEAYTRLGEDYAYGRYEEDFATHDYRFLLEGRLRPLHITPWIAGKWWPVFFSHFDFSAEPISANFDMTGSWHTGRKSVVFVSVDSANPVVRGVAFDRARARLFIRPDFIDGLGIYAQRGASSVRGGFTRRIDFDSGEWRSLDFDLNSNFDLVLAKKIMGPNVAPGVLDLFALERPPKVAIRSHLDGPAAPGGPHQEVHVTCDAGGEFRYGDFPLDGASFAAEVRDDDVTVEEIKAGFAGGTVTGRAHLAGRGAGRHLHFEASLRDASLGPALATVNGFTARRAHRPAPAPGEFVRERANVRLDADLAADGDIDKPSGYHGAGTASLKGAGLGEVRMLGLLSALLRFTSLRFTAAQTDFTLDGSRLFFPDLSVTGANSAIDAKGTYSLADHQLDFRATVKPFKESKSLPQKFMDVMLTPLAEALAVRLVGTIEKPSWVFVNGPGNLLRSLAPPPEVSAPPGKP